MQSYTANNVSLEVRNQYSLAWPYYVFLIKQTELTAILSNNYQNMCIVQTNMIAKVLPLRFRHCSCNCGFCSLVHCKLKLWISTKSEMNVIPCTVSLFIMKFIKNLFLLCCLIDRYFAFIHWPTAYIVCITSIYNSIKQFLRGRNLDHDSWDQSQDFQSALQTDH